MPGNRELEPGEEDCVSRQLHLYFIDGGMGGWPGCEFELIRYRPLR